jgi:mitochondrial fission protein ELM1
MLMPQDECWAITDAAAGNQRQALALAELLGLPVRHLVLQPRPPWSWLSPRLALGGALALRPAQRRLFATPWPRVAVGCGRAAALFTRQLRGMSQGRCYTVQILDPRISTSHWDTVIAPRHDRLSGANVLTPLGSLHSIDDDWLADGRDSCPALGELPQPRVGVLLGGPREGIVLDDDYARQLAQRLVDRQQREGGSLMVLASRRTPPSVIALFREALQNVPGLVWADHGDGANPYPGVLGWADRLVVTPDSVNMLSEACATGCPVETFAPAALPTRIALFHAALRDAGLLHELDTAGISAHPPLRETRTIAAEVRKRIKSHQAQSQSA